MSVLSKNCAETTVDQGSFTHGVFLVPAQTRHTIEAAIQLEIVHLANNCHELIRAGNRSPEMVTALRLSLQWFKENRLGGVVSAAACKASTMSSSQILDLFSLKVAETGIPPLCRDYLHERGVLYIGEIFQIRWDKKSKTRSEIEGFVESLGLVREYTMDTFSWQPPYTTDSGIRALWDKPIGEVLHGLRASDRNFLLLQYHNRGAHFGGQLSIRHQGSPGKMKYVQCELGHGSKLHAGMVVRNWTPPPDLPAEWQQLKEWYREYNRPHSASSKTAT